MIKIVKLITGEELIADVTGGDVYVTLSKPCSLQMVPSRKDPDQPIMGMFPYAAYTEDHCIDVSISTSIPCTI